jgi:hypothetical protein
MDLHHVNSMYRFGLKWYLYQFKLMMEMVNKLNKPKKPKNDLLQKEVHKVVIESEEFVIQDVSLAPEFRVDLLISTFTQEIMRKIIFSVFQEDRQFITYYLTLKIL